MEKNNQTIIITGATGFLGRNLIKKLITNYPKDQILCLIYSKVNSLELSGRKILKRLKIKTKLVDLTTGDGLNNLPKNVRLVFHLAAETDTSKKNHNVNDLGLKKLYSKIRPLSKNSHFIHIGTMIEVVGRPYCDQAINESSSDYPTNEYTRTKLEGEKFIIEKCMKDKFRLTIIRPNTIYGKGVRKDSLFDMVVDFIKKGSIITKINWPGNSALIHVDDLSDLIVNLSKEKPTVGKPDKYLAYAENISIFEISKIIHRKLRFPFKPIVLHNFFWREIKKIRPLIPRLEAFLPYNIYNSLWRFGIIIDDVVLCDSKKIFKKYPNFKPKKFEEAVSDILTTNSR